MLNLNKRTKIGAYTLVMVTLALAVIVVINLLVLNAPTKYTKIDATLHSLYTLSETTKEAIPKINEDINIYLICSGGTDESGSPVNNLPSLSIFLKKYSELNDKIKFSIIDPVVNPTFTDAYDENGLENYTIVVESAKRFKIVDFSELYYYYEQSVGKVATEQYQNFMYYYYYSYGTYPSLTLHFDGENRITSALDYVTTDRIPALYVLEGHGESAPSETLKKSIIEDNMTLASINLLTTAVPEDASCIIINTPTSDINPDEAKMLSDYLAKGGKLFITTVYNSLELPNLMGVLEEYGLSASQGMIVEGDGNRHYNNFPYGLLPIVSSSSTLTASLASSSYIFMPFAHGITSDDTKEGMTFVPLFSTSDSSYTFDEAAETLEKTENSVEGPFDIGVYAYDENSASQIIWCASPAFSDEMNRYTGGNYQYFISMLGGVVERDRIVYNIPANDISTSRLIVSETAANLWSAIFILVVPLSFAVIGFFRWQSRRRR